MKTPTSLVLKFLSPVLLLGLLASAPMTSAYAEDPTTEEITAKLQPKKLTRSLKPVSAGADKQELDAILSRSIGIVERKKIVELTEKAELPRLDFAIKFAYDSAEIEGSSFGVLDSLGEALKSGPLAQSLFMVNGHTDAKGTEEYNQELSQRRADAVVAYLVSRHGIDAGRLQAIGFGELNLKDKIDEESADNRRVEIVNRP